MEHTCYSCTDSTPWSRPAVSRRVSVIWDKWTSLIAFHISVQKKATRTHATVKTYSVNAEFFLLSILKRKKKLDYCDCCAITCCTYLKINHPVRPTVKVKYMATIWKFSRPENTNTYFALLLYLKLSQYGFPPNLKFTVILRDGIVYSVKKRRNAAEIRGSKLG